MGTLCNACGINYRRALVKSAAGRLNLDLLARDMGPSRPSIQKAIKRQKKLMRPPSPTKRSRTVPRQSRRRTPPASASHNAPSSPISMLLCESSSPAEVGSGYSREPALANQGRSPTVARCSEESAMWQNHPKEDYSPSPSILPPFQSLICGIERTAGGDGSRRARLGY